MIGSVIAWLLSSRGQLSMLAALLSGAVVWVGWAELRRSWAEAEVAAERARVVEVEALLAHREAELAGLRGVVARAELERRKAAESVAKYERARRVLRAEAEALRRRVDEGAGAGLEGGRCAAALSAVREALR